MNSVGQHGEVWGWEEMKQPFCTLTVMVVVVTQIYACLKTQKATFLHPL